MKTIFIIILIPILLIVIEYFLSKKKNPLMGLMLPTICGISFVITTWYGILLSILLLVVYFITRHNHIKDNRTPTGIDKMNIEDLN